MQPEGRRLGLTRQEAGRLLTRKAGIALSVVVALLACCAVWVHVRPSRDREQTPALAAAEARQPAIGVRSADGESGALPSGEAASVAEDVLKGAFVSGQGSWPTYRHDEGRTAATPGNLPKRPAVAWHVQVTDFTPGVQSLGAPVVSGGRVYVCTSTSELVCLDAKTGESLWRADLPPMEGFSLKAPSTPTVVGDTVYATEGSELYAVDKDTGEVLWRADRPDDGMGRAVSPLPHLASGVALVCPFVWGTIRDPGPLPVNGFSARTGRLLWRVGREVEWGGRFEAIAGTGNGIAFFTRGDQLVGLDVATGSVRYRRRVPERERGDLPRHVAVRAGRVVLWGYAPNPLYVWRYERRQQPLAVLWEPEGQEIHDIALWEDGAVVHANRQLVCLDWRGEVLWEVEYGPGYVAAGPVIAGTKVVAPGDGVASPDLTAYDLGTGDRLWQMSLEAGAGADAGLAVAGGAVYATSKYGVLSCVGEAQD